MYLNEMDFNYKRNKLMSEAASSRLAKQARGDQPNRAKELVNSAIAFAKRIAPHSAAVLQTGETPQVRLGNERA